MSGVNVALQKRRTVGVQGRWEERNMGGMNNVREFIGRSK